MRLSRLVPFLSLTTSVIFVVTACQKNHGVPAFAVQYTVQIAFAPDGVTCSQTITGGGAPVPTEYIDMSVSRGDTITWQGNNITVNFPSVAPGPDGGEGTPFHTGGVPTTTFTSGQTTSTPVLTGRPTDYLFKFSSISVNRQNCSFPYQGMGVHVSK